MPDNAVLAIQRISDRIEISDAMCRYARGVDRGDWDALRSAYHFDAYDDHGEYKGGIDGLVEWLDLRFAGVDNSIHFLGNCLIEFAGPDVALVETYFASRRLRKPVAGEREDLGPQDQLCRQAWGRYVDRFERRDGEWKVAHRVVVVDAAFTSVAEGGMRSAPLTWGMRDKTDALYAAKQALFGASGG